MVKRSLLFIMLEMSDNVSECRPVCGIYACVPCGVATMGDITVMCGIGLRDLPAFEKLKKCLQMSHLIAKANHKSYCIYSNRRLDPCIICYVKVSPRKSFK